MPLFTNGRPTKLEVEEFIAIQLATPRDIIKFVKLEDIPVKWKHSCVQTGVTELASYTVMVGTAKVDYAVCPCCCKVLYHSEDLMA